MHKCILLVTTLWKRNVVLLSLDHFFLCKWNVRKNVPYMWSSTFPLSCSFLFHCEMYMHDNIKFKERSLSAEKNKEFFLVIRACSCCELAYKIESVLFVWPFFACFVTHSSLRNFLFRILILFNGRCVRMSENILCEFKWKNDKQKVKGWNEVEEEEEVSTF
jgi:hypothetical protein